MAPHRSEWGQDYLSQDTGFNYRFEGHICKLYCSLLGGYLFQIKKIFFSFLPSILRVAIMTNVNPNQYFLVQQNNHTIFLLYKISVESYIKPILCYIWNSICSRGNFFIYWVSSVQFIHSVMSDFATPWTTAHQASLSITNSRSLLKLMSIESVMPSNHLILYHPLLLLPQSLPASGSFPVSQLFTSGGQRLEFQLQHQSFQWTPRTDLL